MCYTAQPRQWLELLENETLISASKWDLISAAGGPRSSIYRSIALQPLSSASYSSVQHIQIAYIMYEEPKNKYENDEEMNPCLWHDDDDDEACL